MTQEIQVGTETQPQGSLAIFVAGHPYSLIVMPLSDSAECLVQYRITKVGGQSYTVTVDVDGEVSCDCASFIYRKHQIDPKGCKHCQCCRNANLLSLKWEPHNARKHRIR